MNAFDLAQAQEAVLAFIERGGPVLIAIFAVTAVMWTAIIERVLYIALFHRRRVKDALAEWAARRERHSWHAHKVRTMLLSTVSERLEQSLGLIKTLIAICPLLGLLGTVTGMIEVFDVMAVSGSGNARAMAGGVSRATIPTMAGMVAALSGLLISTQLQRYATRARGKLAARLALEEETV